MPVHHGLDHRQLEGGVVHVRNQKLPAEFFRKAPRGVLKPEIVEILRRLRTVALKLVGSTGIIFSPEIERLLADHECSVLEREDGRQIYFQFGW